MTCLVPWCPSNRLSGSHRVSSGVPAVSGNTADNSLEVYTASCCYRSAGCTSCILPAGRFHQLHASLMPALRLQSQTVLVCSCPAGPLFTTSRPLMAVSRPLATIPYATIPGTPAPTPTVPSAAPNISGTAVDLGSAVPGNTAADVDADTDTAEVYLHLRPSIFYLPVMSPEHKAAWWWSIMMLSECCRWTAVHLLLWVCTAGTCWR